MVTFLTALLCVSIAGLLGLVVLKRWELTTGRILFSEVRPAVGHLLGRGLHFVERRAPALLRQWGVALYRALRRLVHVGVAWLVVHTERLLERTLHTLRQGTDAPRTDTEASAFLREVAEHKKSLQEGDSGKRGAIYEE